MPQETILRPLLFIICINDILQRVSNICSFADDQIILYSNKSWELTQMDTQNNLLLNIEKRFILLPLFI